ncbi:helix-turn-helix transcriptional regulator [Cellulomonas endophytica]|uniref:helix-turn-helix transcriptional regulator n=1 Tax=Cellulomonas endophytica TaxID=2494735 RepID=UPI0013E955F4|nr:helix-turn-helix transcriptional regulator [Cellulomonas endophytica]
MQQYPLVEREELEEALRLLGDGRRRGLAVVGGPGVGTSTFVQQLLDRTSTPALALRAPSTVRHVPYAALLPLLREEPDALGHPARTLAAASRLLATLGSGTPVTLVLHAAQHVDTDSALLLLALTADERCRLVLVTDGVERLPPDLRVTVQDGVLGTVRLPPFTPAQLARLVEGRWGVPLPHRSLDVLHALTLGHARSAAAVLDAGGCRDGGSGGAARHGDPVARLEPVLDALTWGAPPLAALGAAVPTAHAALSEVEVALLDALALSGGLPVRPLRRAVDQDAVDRLVAGGLARLVERQETLAVPMDAVVAAALRAQAGPTRRDRLLAACFPDGPTTTDRAGAGRWVRWAAACRVAVPAEVAADVAVAAAGREDVGGARAALASVPVAGRTAVHAVLSSVTRALAGGGPVDYLPEDGLAALDLHDDAVLEAVTWALEKGADVVPVPGRPSWSEALWTRLPHAGRDRLAVTAEGLRGCRELHDGRVLAAATILGSETSRPVPAPVPRAAGDRWRHLLLDRADVARALTAGAAAAAPSRGRTGPTAGPDQHLVELLLRFLTGEAVVAAELAGTGRDQDGAAPDLGDVRPPPAVYRLDLVRGLTLLVRGSLADARDLLRPVAAARRASEALPSRIARAALAVVVALEGDDVMVPDLSDDPVLVRAPWLVRRSCRLLELWARAAAGEESAAEGLLEEGTADLAAGRHLTATRFLLAALVVGHEAAAAPLLSAARQVRGPLAAWALGLATAVRDGDVDALVRVAVEAEDQGQHVLALGAARLARAQGRAPVDADLARQARALRSRAPRSTPAPPGASRHGRLTAREDEIARLVARGMPNAEVARLLQLSVRTVEGHVSNVFTKLAVTTRRGLAEALPSASGPSTTAPLRSIG